MASSDMAIITLVETPDGTIAIQTKFDPPMEEWRAEADMLTPLQEAAAVAIGAISNWAAGLPHDETEEHDYDD